jgi:bifunctional UDP-N-acetylglucosamine pyrophosphorylase / glucosamine-1-phosphate N-acetyltransferase
MDTTELLDLTRTTHSSLFEGIKYPWEALPKINPYCKQYGNYKIEGEVHPSAVIEGDVAIGEGTVVGPHVYIIGPAIIGKNCQLRQGAFLRGGVIVGDGAVVGNTCELKNCLLFDETEVPHFAYVGDSILGHKAHLGAGVKISNVKLDFSTIKIKMNDEVIDTGLIKFGAILGDKTDVGCNSVLNPGSIIGRGSVLYPCTSWRGICPPNSIVKLRQTQQIVTINQ